MSNFFENFYGTLFAPDETFNKLKEEKPLLQSMVIVIFISTLGIFFNFNFSQGINDILWLGFGLFWSVISGVISWIFFAAFLEIMAAIFNHSGKMKTFLVLSGFALVPWFFLAPINLMKTGGFVGIFFATILGLFIWVWVSVLYFVAMIKTYELTLGRGLLLIALPFLAGWVGFHWLVGFGSTLYQILKL